MAVTEVNKTLLSSCYFFLFSCSSENWNAIIDQREEKKSAEMWPDHAVLSYFSVQVILKWELHWLPIISRWVRKYWLATNSVEKHLSLLMQGIPGADSALVSFSKPQRVQCNWIVASSIYEYMNSARSSSSLSTRWLLQILCCELFLVTLSNTVQQLLL